MVTLWIVALLVGGGMALAAGRGEGGTPLTMAEGAWEHRVFPPEGLAEGQAATLAIVQEPGHGACLSIGPWWCGEHSARFQYAAPLPFTRGVVRGLYRTEELPIFGAVVQVEYRAAGKRVVTKYLELDAAREWTPFEFAFRCPPPRADSVSPGFGLSAQSHGRVLFADLTFSPDPPPLSLPAEPGPITRPAPPRPFPASGYYRVEESKGAWWLVTPEGKPCYSLGTDGPWFRSEEDRDTRGPRAAEGLAGAGFNSLAGWTDVRAWGKLNEDRSAAGKPAFATFAALETGGWREGCDQLVDAQGRTTGRGHAFPDPFDPRFEQKYRERVRRVAALVRGKPWFVGYFADNEISHRELARHLWSPHCAAAFREALSQQYGGEIGRLNAAWGTGFASFEELIANKPEPARQGPRHDDFERFARQVVARYAETTYRVLREEDPDHLVISNRFMLGDVTAWVDYLDFYARFDIIAVNLYPSNQRAGLSETERDIYRLVHAKTGRPLIVGEWSVPAADSGLYDNPERLDWSWNEVVANQTERARQAARVTLDFYNLPFLVGAHWFIWQDVDNEQRQANRGLMRANGEPWPELVEALRGAHAKIRAAQGG